MYIKPFLVIALISVLSNPVYNVDNAHVNYTMTHDHPELITRCEPRSALALPS